MEALNELHPNTQARREHEAREAAQRQAKQDAIDVMGANAQLQSMKRSAKGQLEPPKGWEWAKAAKEAQHNGKR